MLGKFAKVGVAPLGGQPHYINSATLPQQAGASCEPGHLLRIKVREGLATLCFALQERSPVLVDVQCINLE